MIALGIDIGGTSIKSAVLTESSIAWTGRTPPYRRPGTEQLEESLQSLLAAAAPWRDKVHAVGLCVPGVMDSRRRSVMLSANVPGLIGVDLRALLERVLGKGIAAPAIITDARAAAHDIWTTRRLEGRLLGLSLGTGVGGCVLDNGVPVRLTGESSGHIGQIDVSLGEGSGGGGGGGTSPPLGPDGGRGSLEAYIGLPALHANYGPDLDKALSSLGADDEPLRALARAIRIAHAIYRPEHVCLLGGVGLRLFGSLPALRFLIEDGLTSLARAGWTLTTGESEFHAAQGAAKLAASGATG